MVLILVVGESHVPMRSAAIPEAFKSMLTPGRIQKTFVTGNIACRELHDYFRTVSNQLHCTYGEFDSEWSTSLPQYVCVEVEGLKIGMIHGHQVVPEGDKESLAAVQRKLDVDVLIYGTPAVAKLHEFDGRAFVNPGSITGAFSPTEGNILPSFVLLDIKDKHITSFTYQYNPLEAVDSPESGLKIKKKEWTKEY
ncbi:vacuolar sorting protein [Angomonas deanei]|nr:vacuolar sorting protein [Angomonas deanei]EPY38049.1 vacuolar sorting protein [Angomonas deanei]EPY42114.1 vacuolar sorting protein [Angomonas deanei]|eukprot:EPY36752.1 vacuolar sorting protein [Angomonas deanei]